MPDSKKIVQQNNIPPITMTIDQILEMSQNAVTQLKGLALNLQEISKRLEIAQSAQVMFIQKNQTSTAITGIGMNRAQRRKIIKNLVKKKKKDGLNKAEEAQLKTLLQK